MTMLLFDPSIPHGYETSKNYETRLRSGFWQTYAAGPNVLDIGYRGGVPDAQPLCTGAHGIELGDPGYDGFHLPYADGWANTVHASHVLEHVTPTNDYLQEWFRVLAPGGRMILFVPSLYLYERRLTVPPSRWSPEHLRSYSPSSLLKEIEYALTPNTWRLRHMADNDVGYDYSLPINVHPTGALEIECVIQKIEKPEWDIEP